MKLYAMSSSSRLFIYGPVALLALIIGLYGLYWKVSADMLSARLDRANGGEIMPGVVFAFAGKSVGGFPFGLNIVLEGVTFAHEGPAGETAWRSEKIAIHALFYGKGQYALETTGLQSFAQPNEYGGPPRVLYITPHNAHASAILNGGELTRFDLDLSQVEGKDASLGAPPDRTFTAGRAQLHFEGNADQTILVAARLEGAKIGQGYAAPLGRDLALATLRGKITQDATLQDIRAGREGFNSAAERWRSAKGALDVDSLYIKSDTTDGETLAGAITLNAARLLEGTLRSPAHPKGIVLGFRNGALLD